MSNILTDNYDAFISYKHNTGFYMARVIYDKLIQNGYSVFMDKDLPRGDGEFEQQIKNAVERSRNFIIVLFPRDLDKSNSEKDWLRKESEWATNSLGINIIPVFCNNFDRSKIKVELPDCLNTVLGHQGVPMHKDSSLDSDLNTLCDRLRNVNPVQRLIGTDTVKFFEKNLPNQPHSSVKIECVDMAFHGGTARLTPGTSVYDIFNKILNQGIHVRVLINTPEAVENIAKHMRNSKNKSLYNSFEELQQVWANRVSADKELLEVRACPIPLLHAYHNIKFKNTTEWDRMLINHYVYQSFNPETNFQYELSISSKYYEMYQNEFEFLWNESKPL